ncbi:MAG: hypothetical protein ACTSRP_16340 [Candidatus Helarchaeota archaeon]
MWSKKSSKNRSRNIETNKDNEIEKNKKKEGPSNYFEIGITYAFHYYINYNNVKRFCNATGDVAKVLKSIDHKFKGKCITTNIF